MDKTQKGRIFISYRRTDTAGYTGRLYDRLTNHFGKDAVFMDVATIEAGLDFVNVLRNAVQSCDVLIVVIGKQWVNIKDDDGKRRLENPEDFVRVEIEAALERDIRVIPVLIDGTRIPRSNELPSDLQPLVRRNALQLDHHSFDADANRLISQVERVIGTLEGKKVEARPWMSLSSIVGIAILLLFLILGGINLWKTFTNVEPEPTLTTESMSTMTFETLSPQVQSIVKTNTPLSIETLTSPTTTPDGSSTLIGKDSMVLLLVPAGNFSMGSSGYQPDERPVNSVFIDGYFIDQTEVTNAMYASCVNAGKCETPQSKTSILQNASNNSFYYGNPSFDNYPVIYISWENAKNYCEWVGRRLPTEAEWEKAANWDNSQKLKFVYPWGNDIDCTYANYYGDGDKLCVGDTTPVGNYPTGASFYGALDMAGNVSEWVADRYDPEYYNDLPERNPTGPRSGENMVVRGGSFLVGRANEVRSSDRDYKAPDYTSYSLGFRCAMDAE